MKKQLLKNFKDVVVEILKDGNMVTFEVNSPENKGVVVNEWSKVIDCGVKLPDVLLTSQTYDIDEGEAWRIVDDLGIIYPDVTDWSE